MECGKVIVFTIILVPLTHVTLTVGYTEKDLATVERRGLYLASGDLGDQLLDLLPTLWPQGVT